MTLTVGVLQGGANSHTTTSEEINFFGTDFISEGVVGAVTNTSGVAPATGAFAVNAQGSPDMTVAVSAGAAYVTATPTSGNSQLLRVKNSASANVTIAANSTGGTRYDFVYIKIDPDKAKDPASDASDVATLTTSRSTSATTDNGTPPTYGYPIAVVTVANGASSITNGNIADKRARTGLATASLSAIIFDHVSSGCVWSGDSYGSTRAASMTAGTVYIGGVSLVVAAVTARTFTASKDTYIDLSDNGDGTAAITYTEVTNNAASPALAANSIRIGIIVTGASTIANAGSVNQGQESSVLPIASSVAYSVTDSLGNRICSRDPNRRLLGYKQITSNVTATTVAQMTGLSCPVIIPTGRKVKITTWSVEVGSSSSAATVVVSVWDGTVGSGTQLTQANNASGTGVINLVQANASVVTTPSSTSKTYNAGLQASAGTATCYAGSTFPAYIMVELI